MVTLPVEEVEQHRKIMNKASVTPAQVWRAGIKAIESDIINN